MRTTIATILFLGALGVIAACGKITGLDDVPVTEDGPRAEDGGAAGRPDAKPPTTGNDGGPAKPACIERGVSGCANANDCCKPAAQTGEIAICTASKCSACKANNAVCGDSDICCSGRRCSSTGTCPEECRINGVACENDGQCCDPTDASAKFECRADRKCAKCQPEMGTCAATTDCCGALKCKANKKCGTCLSANSTGCKNNDDCCDGSVCSTDTDNPALTRCVDKCWPQWSIANVATPCKNAAPGFENRPCCAPFKCNFDIPSSEATGCGP